MGEQMTQIFLLLVAFGITVLFIALVETIIDIISYIIDMFKKG